MNAKGAHLDFDYFTAATYARQNHSHAPSAYPRSVRSLVNGTKYHCSFNIFISCILYDLVTSFSAVMKRVTAIRESFVSAILTACIIASHYLYISPRTRASIKNFYLAAAAPGATPINAHVGAASFGFVRARRDLIPRAEWKKNTRSTSLCRGRSLRKRAVQRGCTIFKELCRTTDGKTDVGARPAGSRNPIRRFWSVCTYASSGISRPERVSSERVLARVIRRYQRSEFEKSAAQRSSRESSRRDSRELYPVLISLVFLFFSQAAQPFLSYADV